MQEINKSIGDRMMTKDRSTEAENFLKFFGEGDNSELKDKKEKQKKIPSISLKSSRKNKKERYTFSLDPEIREHLSQLKSVYGIRSDSALIEELIETLWNQQNDL